MDSSSATDLSKCDKSSRAANNHRKQCDEGRRDGSQLCFCLFFFLKEAEETHSDPVSFGGGEILPYLVLYWWTNGGRKKIIHFSVKIPVKIKLGNPLSPNNFTLADKRLNSLKQVSQKYQRACFLRSWNNPLSPTQFQISRPNTRYAIFERREGGETHSGSLWGINRVYIEPWEAINGVIWGLSPPLQFVFCIK